MNGPPDKEARPGDGDAHGRVGVLATGLAADPTPGWRLALLGRRRASRELTALCEHLDGGGIVLPDVGERCPRWCSAMDRSSLDYWVGELGSCPCPRAREAVAS